MVVETMKLHYTFHNGGAVKAANIDLEKIKLAIDENWLQLNYDQVVSEITSNLKAVYSNAQAVLQNYLSIKEIAADPSLYESTFLMLTTREISFPEYLAEVQLIFVNQLNFPEVERDYFLLMNKIALLYGY